MNKKEYLRRAIDECIAIHFDGNILSSHIISRSILRVSEDLLKNTNNNSAIDRIKKHIRPNKEKEFFQHFNKVYNFFKHAENDENDEIEFNPESNDFIILSCVGNLQLLDINTKYTEAYMLWMFCMYPNILKDELQNEDFFQSHFKKESWDVRSKALLRYQKLLLGKAFIYFSDGDINNYHKTIESICSNTLKIDI